MFMFTSPNAKQASPTKGNTPRNATSHSKQALNPVVVNETNNQGFGSQLLSPRWQKSNLAVVT